LRRTDVPPRLRATVERVERFRQELRAGLLGVTTLGTVEREGLICWLESEEAFERAYKVGVMELVSIFRARAEAGH
jgi:hypothetical protein